MPESRDPRKDPRPGDVVQFQKKWTRHIEQRDGNTVGYYALFHGTYLGPFQDKLEDWVNAVDHAEVLHVAE